jgi:hypothetical protein
MEPEMADQSTNDRGDSLDRATSASIRRAIGEKLLGTISTELSDIPPRLQSLLAAMQRQEDQQRIEVGSSG